MEAATKTTDIEGEISRAMRARVKDFKEQADSLTLEGIRRALEKELEMEKFSLDVHKMFIKQCLSECFTDADDESESRTLETAAEAVQPVKDEASIQHEDLQPLGFASNGIKLIGENTLNVYKGFIRKELDTCCTDADDENKSRTLETAAEAVQSVKDEASIQHEDLQPSEPIGSASNGIELVGEIVESQVVEDDSCFSEEKISNTLKKRAAYVRENVEKISFAEVRRILEGDLNLEKNTLDVYKGFIRKELDMVLVSAELINTTDGIKKRKTASPTEASEKTRTLSKSGSRDLDSLDYNEDISRDEEDDEERRLRKRPVQKNKESTKQTVVKKKAMSDSKSSTARKRKPLDQDSDNSSESEDGNSLGGNHSNSSAEENVKKKIEKPTQVYTKQVEHLKSIIKSCGIGIPPLVYRRVKQAPESKCESFLIKELEDILEKEGLSTNPSEKDMARPGGRRSSSRHNTQSDDFIGTSHGGQDKCAASNVAQKKYRGKAKGKKADKLLESTKEKIRVDFNELGGRPVGTNASLLVTDLGILARTAVPLRVKTYKAVPTSVRAILMERVHERYHVDANPTKFQDYCLEEIGRLYKLHKGKLSKIFKSFASPEIARQNKPEDVDDQDDWDWLCDRFDSPGFRKLSMTNKQNRDKLLYNHTGGTKSFVAHQASHPVVNEEGVMISERLGPIDLFRNTHSRPSGTWVAPEAQSRYDAMLQMRGQQTQEIQALGGSPADVSEVEICAQILGHRPGYVRGQGYGPKPPLKSGNDASSSSGYRALQEQVRALQEREEAREREFQEREEARERQREQEKEEMTAMVQAQLKDQMDHFMQQMRGAGGWRSGGWGGGGSWGGEPGGGPGGWPGGGSG